MLPKDQRYSFTWGLPSKRLVWDDISVRYQKNTLGYLRCAIVIGKRACKKSVDRHRLKRRFSAALQEIGKDHPYPYDLIFYIQKNASNKTYTDLKTDIATVLQKIT